MPGADYSVHSPLLMTIKYPAQSFAANATLPAIPIPTGWVASVRGLLFTCTTLFAGTTNGFALFQLGDGTTVNKYAQAQLGNNATPFAALATFTVFFAPPLAGVNVAGLGTVTPASESGLTGRNPNNAAVEGVSGPFLFAAGGTSIIPTIVAPTGGTVAGIADAIVLIELSNAG